MSCLPRHESDERKVVSWSIHRASRSAAGRQLPWVTDANKTIHHRERERRTKQHVLDHVMSDFEDANPFGEDDDHLQPPPAPVLAPTLSTDDEREGTSTAARSAATAEVYTRKRILLLQRRIFAFKRRRRNLGEDSVNHNYTATLPPNDY